MTIQEILRDHGIEFASAGEHHHARTDWLAIKDCPFCGSSGYHLGFNIRRNYFNCWKCRGHRIADTLLRLGVPEVIAIAFSGDRELLPREIEKERIKLVEPRGRGPLLQPHKDYLRRRGIAPERLGIWDLEGIGRDGGKLSWRIYIPITFQGRRRSWTTRAIGENVEPRYISASPEEESINHKHILYGLDHVLHSVIVVEGPADAWNVGAGAVATFGVGFSNHQTLLLSKIPYRLICFDNSLDAQKRARNLASDLSVFPGKTGVVQLDAEDPGSASLHEVNLLRKEARLL